MQLETLLRLGKQTKKEWFHMQCGAMLSRLPAHLKNREISDVNDDEVETHLKTYLSPNTIPTYLSALKVVREKYCRDWNRETVQQDDFKNKFSQFLAKFGSHPIKVTTAFEDGTSLKYSNGTITYSWGKKEENIENMSPKNQARAVRKLVQHLAEVKSQSQIHYATDLFREATRLLDDLPR